MLRFIISVKISLSTDVIIPDSDYAITNHCRKSISKDSIAKNRKIKFIDELNLI